MREVKEGNEGSTTIIEATDLLKDKEKSAKGNLGRKLNHND